MSQQCPPPEQFHLNLDEQATGSPSLPKPSTPVAIVLETTGTHVSYALTQLDANR